MSAGDTTPRYSSREELANCVSHGLGALLAIPGLALLTRLASARGDAWHVVACSVFGATLVFLYLTSTLYHAIRHPRAKSVLRFFDHAAIFLLIAGTYTPFTLINLRGPWGWSLFGVVWGIAILGIIFEVTIRRRWPGVSVALYILMGWTVVVAIKPMLSAVAPGGLVLLLIGGLAYTTGVVFYIWRRLPYHHAVWHLFVLAGSILHFFAVLFHAIPSTRSA